MHGRKKEEQEEEEEEERDGYSTNETRRKTYWAVKGFAVKGG